jgi:hypothetical protein
LSCGPTCAPPPEGAPSISLSCDGCGSFGRYEDVISAARAGWLILRTIAPDHDDDIPRVLVFCRECRGDKG